MQKSKRRITLVLVAITSLWCLVSCGILDPDSGIGPTFPGPAISIPDSTFNFGFVPQNSTVTHDFIVKSVGTDTLRILRVANESGAISVELNKNELPPGDSCRMRVSFRTKRARSRITKRVLIESNADSAGLVVTILGDIVRRPDSTYPLVISPHKLFISQFGPIVRDSLSFTVTNRTMDDLNVTLIDWPKDLLDVNTPRSITGESKMTGFIKLKSTGIASSFERSITLQVSDSRNSQYTIPVKRTFFLSDLQLIPGAQLTEPAAVSPTL